MMNRGGFLFIFVQRFWVNPLSVLIKVESPIVKARHYIHVYIQGIYQTLLFKATYNKYIRQKKE